MLENDFGTLGEYVILNDVGGNDGGLWSDNVAQGTPNANLRSLRAGGSAFESFHALLGRVSLPTTPLLTLTPPRSVGMGYVQENEDVNIFARLIYFTVAPSGTPGLQYSDETSNMVSRPAMTSQPAELTASSMSPCTAAISSFAIVSAQPSWLISPTFDLSAITRNNNRAEHRLLRSQDSRSHVRWRQLHPAG